MPRTIVIKITVENRQAIAAIDAQRQANKLLNDETRFLAAEQRKGELHALKLAKANKDLETSQKSLVASIVQGYVVGKAVSAVYTNIANSIGYAITQSIQFEFAMAKINAISGAGKATLQSLETTIRDLAAANSLNQNELAKTALEMSKMGLSSRSVEEAIGGVAQLARALDEDLVATGETVVSILNVYNFSAEEAARVTDQLAFTVKASALDIQKFGTAFSYVGGTAAAAGVSFEDLQASMDVLSNAGIKSSTIGTQLRRIMADLSNENSDASAAIGGNTISTLGYVGALQALKEKNLDISDLTAIFGRTASSVAAILIKYSSAVEDMARQTKEAKGLTKELADLMKDNVQTGLDGVAVSWTNLGIEISKSAGFLKEFLGLTKRVIDANTQSIQRDNIIDQFKERDPKNFAKAKAKIAGRMAGGDFLVEETPEFTVFKKQLEFEAADQKAKENIVDEVMRTLQQDFKLPKGFDPGTQIDLIPVEDTRAFQVLESLYGGNPAVFAAAVKQAKLNLALKLEMVNTEEFDSSVLDDKKKKKKKEKERLYNYNYSPYTPQMGPFEEDGYVPFVDQGMAEQIRFDLGKRHKENAASKAMRGMKDDNAPLSMANQAEADINRFSPQVTRYIQYLQEANQETENFNFALEFTKTSFETLSDASNLFGDSLVDALLGHEDAFSNFQDNFGNLMKAFIAQIIAAEVRLLAFKAAIKLFSWAVTAYTGNPAAGAAVDAGANIAVNATMAADGYDGIVNSPKMFIAGEAGPERVTVTPLGKQGSSNDSGGGTVIHVHGDVFNAEKLVDKIAMTNERSKTRYI